MSESKAMHDEKAMHDGKAMHEDYAMFSAVWKFFRAHSAAGAAADWDSIFRQAEEIQKQFSTDFCKRLLLCALDELEQRWKEAGGK